MPETPLRDYGSGLAPVGEGWFVVNARDAWWGTVEGLGFSCMFEHWEAPFPQLGIRLTVLEPGQPNAVYHSESEGEERPLRACDFFHSPAGTHHIFVGAGDGPCVIAMCGARTEDEQLHYPVSDVAARYGASVSEETTDPDQAYAPFGSPTLGRPPHWNRLPWS